VERLHAHPELTVELGQEVVPGQRFASVKLDGLTLFSEVVYDTREVPAERNILLLFSSRLRRLLED
jgi:hypothetical protein